MLTNTLGQNLLFSTLRIETEYADPNLRGAGTGFIFSIDTDRGSFLTVVTNKHVIDGATVGRFFFTVAAHGVPKIGKRFDIGMGEFEGRWYRHPDPQVDIAAMVLAPVLHELKNKNVEVFFRALSPDNIPNNEQLASLDVSEEVLFVGYPNGLYDTTNLLPIIRRGHTATPLQVDYCGQPQFLIDASVFPGSSGSPVVIYNLGGYGSTAGFSVGTRFMFLGVISAVLIQEENGQLEFQTIPTKMPFVRTKQMLDLGVVFKARTVVETVEGLHLASIGHPIQRKTPPSS